VKCVKMLLGFARRDSITASRLFYESRLLTLKTIVHSAKWRVAWKWWTWNIFVGAAVDRNFVSLLYQ